MKKRSNAFRIIALIILLMVWTLFRFHMVSAIAMKISVIAAIILSLAGTIITIINRNKTAPKKTGLQKVSSIIIYLSAFGVITALILIILHIPHIGRPLLNSSLALFIVGIITIMASLPTANNTTTSPVLKQQSIIYNILLCLGMICTVIGLILRINHYPDGKQLMYGGLAFTMIFLVIIIAYAGYMKKRGTL